MSEEKSFFGYTKIDGDRVLDAPSHWPFGTIGPISEYSFRYAPDSAVYEKQPRTRKTGIEPEAVEAVGTPAGAFAFGALVATLVTFGDKS